MKLSEREQEILALIVKELSSQEIATKLKISVRTVDTHRKHIGKKLQTTSLIGLTKYAIQEGMIEGFRYSGKK
ncbi:MAG: LuxR C-terminal-related transcriptional regulator [Reichenbachiella sp.]|uniref:response regulator transcription factor n=1 Tax=Reichenbachiella sp. TaxID=2184521 RepID=UPI00296670CF|nr:LuxR C-terminal-related transcriptional regulator [Reichenbachiella sp.]MDW3209175.1 LuxR C-terminal-related transcriptional regulator [Reichenbachiella sp.]